MTGKSAFFATALTLLVAPASADTLSDERLRAIGLAFDQVLADPELNTERLSPQRWQVILSAYDTHGPTYDVDRLSSARLANMRLAYKTLDPVRDTLALVD